MQSAFSLAQLNAKSSRSAAALGKMQKCLLGKATWIQFSQQRQDFSGCCCIPACKHKPPCSKCCLSDPGPLISNSSQMAPAIDGIEPSVGTRVACNAVQMLPHDQGPDSTSYGQQQSEGRGSFISIRYTSAGVAMPMRTVETFCFWKAYWIASRSMDTPWDLACAAALAHVSRTSLGAGCHSGGPCIKV